MVSCALPLIPWAKQGILESTDFNCVHTSVIDTALDIYTLGYPEQARSLLYALHEHGDALQAESIGRGRELKLFHVWDFLESFPDWVLSPLPHKHIDGFKGIEANMTIDEKRACVNFAKPPYDTTKLNREYLDAVVRGMNTDSPSWTDIFYRSSSGASRGEGESPRYHGSLGLVVPVAVDLDDIRKAAALTQKHTTEIYRRIQQAWDDPQCSAELTRGFIDDRMDSKYHAIWYFLSKSHIGRNLGVSEKDIDAFVKENDSLLETRLKRAPLTPCAGKSISETVGVMKENCIASQKSTSVADLGAERSSDSEPPGTSANFLQPACYRR